MFRQAGIFLIVLLLMASSCRQPDTPLPANTTLQPPTIHKDIDQTFDSPVIVFIYPDNAQINSLKKTLGTDNYFALSDKNGAEFAKIRLLAKNQKLATFSGNPGTYRFITQEGAIIDMDLSRMTQSWKVIVFNGIDAPMLANPGNASQLLFQDSQNSQKKNRVNAGNTKTDAPSSITEISPPARADREVGAIAEKKETTIRLLIFPGQAPPPLRDASSGIRIVNSYISPNHRFWLNFDNDMFSNTDRYYTNGVVLGYTAPGLTNWSINRLMIARNRNSIVHSSLSLHHGIFTPLTTKEQPTLSNDRPYSSTLYLRYSQTSEDALAGIRFTTAIEAGVIGDAALGQLLQRSVHAGIPTNDEPLGWETQIKNDLVLNYSVGIQKQLLKSRNAEVYAEGSASAGTLHTRGTIGVNAVAGLFRPNLTPLPDQYDKLSKAAGPWQVGIRGGMELRMIGYDATLQGGLFNKDNVYALKPEEMDRLVAAIHLGLFANYRKLGISLSQYYLSPEFREGREHFWGQIGVQYGL